MDPKQIENGPFYSQFEINAQMARDIWEVVMKIDVNIIFFSRKKKEKPKPKYRSYTEARKDREKFRKRLVEVKRLFWINFFIPISFFLLFWHSWRLELFYISGIFLVQRNIIWLVKGPTELLHSY